MEDQLELPEIQRQAVEAYERHGCNESAAAKELGIDHKAIRSRLWSAVKNGWPVRPNSYCEHAPVGFGLHAQSILVGRDGETLLTWHKVREEQQSVEDIAEYLRHRIPAAATSRAPKKTQKGLMLEWPIADLHLGMLSWAKETGADYDLGIARELMTAAASKIFSTFGNVEESVLSFLGDNQHADNRQNRTEKSGHILDVDSRYPKTAMAIYEIATTAIDMALQSSKIVRVVIVPGNHDPMSAIHFCIVLSAHYRNDRRVIIDTSPTKHKFYRWGSNFFMATHSDTGTKRLASYMMNHVIRNNLVGIERMYVRAGHLHKRGKTCPPGMVEEDGVVVELYPTIAPADAWATEEAYSNIRATVANLWHREYGRRSMIELGIKELMEGK